MLRIKFLLFLSLLVINLQGQDISNFLRSGGVKILSNLAHPTNEYLSGEYSVSDDGKLVQVTAYSKDSFWGNTVRTTITLSRQGYFFTGLRVDYDNDSVDPFAAVTILKAALNQQITESFSSQEQSMLGSFERFVGKQLVHFNGIDTSLILLSLAFYNW